MLGLGLGIPHGNFVYDTSLLGVAPTGLKLWLKNNTGVTTAKWEDSSGNNNHVLQTNAGNRAALSGADANGNVHAGGLDFESSESDHYDLDTNGVASGTISVASNGGFCIAVVVSRESSAISTIASGPNGAFQFGKTSPPDPSNSGVFSFIGELPSATTSEFHFDTGTFGYPAPYLILLNRTAGSSGKFTFMKNGSTLTPDVDNSVNVGTGGNTKGFDINVIGAKEGVSDFFDGMILELAVWDRSLTAAEIAGVNSYLTGIHGL